MKTAVIVLAVLAASAHAQVAFKGLPLGSERQQLLAQFPSLQCARPPTQLAKLGDEHCTENTACMTPACMAASKALATYAGAPAWDNTFAILNGRVEQFTATINKSSYEAVRDALREVHGAGVESVQPMQTLGGATLRSRVWDGTTAGGKITVFEMAGQIDQGFVVGESAVFTQWLRSSSGSKKNSKDL